MAKSPTKVELGGDWVKLKTTVQKVDMLGYSTLFKALVSGANKLRNYTIKSMQDTQKASWFYMRGKKTHFPSAPGNPPAVDTGGLLAALVVDVRKSEVEFGATSAAPYGAILEKGTKRMASRPWLEPAIDEITPDFKSEVDKIIKDMFK